MLIPLAPAGPMLDPSSSRWPVIDHGWFQAPNGLSAGISALQSLAGTFSAQLGNTITPLGRPGFYPEKGPLAAALIAQAEVLASNFIYASIHASLAALSKADRDELVYDNIVAALALSTNPVPVALFDNGTIPALFATVIAGNNTSLTMINPAENAPVTWQRQATDVFSALVTRVVADQPPVTVSDAVPVTSFTTRFEKIGRTLNDLTTLVGLSGTMRQQKNDAIADLVGIPAVPLQVQAGPGLPPVPVENDTVVVRGESTTMWVPLVFNGSSSGFMINLPTTGAELARVDGTSLPLANLPNLASLQNFIPTNLVLSPFARVGGLLRQVSARMIWLICVIRRGSRQPEAE